MPYFEYELCPNCNELTLAPVFCVEHGDYRLKKNQTRIACSHLLCELCGHIVITDGEYLSHPWYPDSMFYKMYPELEVN